MFGRDAGYSKTQSTGIDSNSSTYRLLGFRNMQKKLENLHAYYVNNVYYVHTKIQLTAVFLCTWKTSYIIA